MNIPAGLTFVTVFHFDDIEEPRLLRAAAHLADAARKIAEARRAAPEECGSQGHVGVQRPELGQVAAGADALVVVVRAVEEVWAPFPEDRYTGLHEGLGGAVIRAVLVVVED